MVLGVMAGPQIGLLDVRPHLRMAVPRGRWNLSHRLLQTEMRCSHGHSLGYTAWFPDRNGPPKNPTRPRRARRQETHHRRVNR